MREIISKRGGKLLNARTTSGDYIGMDVRQGLERPQLATVDGKEVVRVKGPTLRVGGAVLQHVELQSLGGTISRVIDLERARLTTFTLPEDLTVYPDQKETSCFASNPIIRINFNEVLTVLGEAFLEAVFLSDMEDEREVLLQRSNGRPLHVDGLGHRNELVVGFDPNTIRNPYRIGVHTMVGVHTLNEELAAGELLISIYRKESWIPFYDTLLPVFKKAVHIPDLSTWDCLLFEVLGPSGAAGEYVAVEKHKPHRLLAKKSRSKVEPKIITSKTKVLNDPEEMSALAKFFLSPGMLVEVN
ncbi:MAG: hypothetical protein AAF597_14650 [Bacteroidota bacterium]